MKVSLNTIRQYVDFELPSVDELVRRINEQLGGVEEVVDFSAKYQGIVIAKVVKCVPHPDSDHLHICEIDPGKSSNYSEFRIQNSEYVQVVCGAPNVREGLMVAWLPPGITVPSSADTADPFVLGAREIRGVMSHGMLASPAELAIGDSHEGILEITQADLPPFETPTELNPGLDFAETFGLDDTVIDIENKMFTHRPDCFGQLGVAREISAIIKGLPHDGEDVAEQRFVNPEWYWAKPSFGSADALPLTVTNDAPDKAPRFMAVVLSGLTVKPSPFWLQCELVRLGAKPINNVVDLTNYIMLVTAQPTHAYDYDTLRGHTLGVRLGRSGENVSLLNGKTYDVSDDDIVIVDAEGPVGMAGVMGGNNSEVSAETKNIVLECATFDMYTIRKTSMRHGLFTDAVSRFNKGQSRLQNDRVLARLMSLMGEYAGANQASAVFDEPNKADALEDVSLSGEISVSGEFINRRLGLKLSVSEIGGLLRRANFASYPAEDDPNTLVITAPFWRTDIELPEDIVEEVGRLYGFDKLPRELPRRSMAPASQNTTIEMRRKIRQILSGAGANEVKTYSFVHERVLKGSGQDVDQAFKLGNALSPDLQYFRVSILPSLLDKVHANIKAGHDEFALFEFGKAHNTTALDNEDLPKEVQALGYVYAAKRPQSGAAYYHARRALQLLLDESGITSLVFESLDGADLYDNPWLQQMTAPFEPKRSAVLRAADDTIGNTKGLVWGVVGEYKASVRRAFKLPDYSAGFEIDPVLFTWASSRSYKPLARFPHVTQDISLKVATTVSFGEVFAAAKLALSTHRNDELSLQLVPLGIYQAGDDSEYKTITLRLKATNYLRTLTDAEVSGYLDSIAVATQTQHQAERI